LALERADVSSVERAVGLKVCQLCAVDFTLRHFLLPLIDGMQSKGWRVVSVCSTGSLVPQLRKDGYPVETINISRSLNPLKALVSLYQLIKFFHRENFDVVHVHTPVAALVGRLAARIAKVPFVIYTAHGFYFHERMPWGKYLFYLWLERFAGHFTNLLFTQSDEDAQTAIRKRILPATRVFAIGNGVDPEQFNERIIVDGRVLRGELGIPQNAFVITYIGRLVKEKGLIEFLKAAKIVAARFSTAWFLIIGERLKSDHSSSIERDLVSAKEVLGRRLVEVGYRNDIPLCLAASSALCLPSWREGMPRVIIEAMMMSRPVVATDIRGSREEVVDQETGILVPVQSPLALADAFERMIQHPEWAGRLGAAGRMRALRLYDERDIVSKQILLIEQSLAALSH